MIGGAAGRWATREVNLNLGCPSGTVTAKGKGAGMLRDLDALDRFLDTVFSEAGGPISVKTPHRGGKAPRNSAPSWRYTAAIPSPS